MKINGALKPRQGASIKGSSPGVVPKKYRVKRYFNVNKNVINSLSLNACGVNIKKLTENIIKSYNFCNNNQQQATTTLTQQTEQKRKSREKYCGSINNSRSSSSIIRRSKFPTSKKTKKQIYLLKNNKGHKVSVISKRNACNINLNKNKLQQSIVAAAEAVAVAVAEKAIGKNNENKPSIEITTRRTKDTKLNRKSDERNTKLKVKVLKTTLNTSKYHFAFNKKHNNQYNSNGNSTLKEVNKFLFISQINENLNLTAIIWRLFIQLKLLLFSTLSHAMKHLNGNPIAYCGGSGRGTADVPRDRSLVGYNFAKMMRDDSFNRICLKNAWGINPSIALCLLIYAATAICLPQPVAGDNDDTFFPTNGLETTTPEFDYASRGQKKFGDKCENTLECGFPGSICDPKKKSCQCTEDLPVTNHIDKCGKEAAVNESCFFNEQCEVKYFQTECRDQRCVCRFDMTPAWLKDGSVECKGRGDKKGPETYVDPAMIGVLIGMALMFIIICVVLRLFSQARWRENRTIFNTPNPRLMNVSLLRESKLLHGQERRGSRMSVRAPSRQPSMASLRPHSPNPSLGKTGSRSNSHGIIVGNNSHHERKGSTYQPHQHHHQQQQKLQQEQQPLTQTNIISNPVAETVTVEIIEPEK